MKDYDVNDLDKGSIIGGIVSTSLSFGLRAAIVSGVSGATELGTLFIPVIGTWVGAIMIGASIYNYFIWKKEEYFEECMNILLKNYKENIKNATKYYMENFDELSNGLLGFIKEKKVDHEFIEDMKNWFWERIS